MIKIENTEVFGWEAAIRGMRNPKNSWDLSDTAVVEVPDTPRLDYLGNVVEIIPAHKRTVIIQKDEGWTGVGEKDLKLMKTLAKAGDDHGKFLRMINVTVDLTAPLYWWKEHDQYKVGTTTNSCSTMHKIHAKEFTLDDFSHEHLTNFCLNSLRGTIDHLNLARRNYLELKNKMDWWQMIQLLPSSYNQKRTVQLNYAVLKNMYFARRHHKLDEWHTLCEWVLTLPYFKEICVQGEE
jgi:hypothetical protein